MKIVGIWVELESGGVLWAERVCIWVESESENVGGGVVDQDLYRGEGCGWGDSFFVAKCSFIVCTCC